VLGALPWIDDDFKRNNQTDALGKDCGGSGTVISACFRSKSWMLCGNKDGDVCARICWDSYPELVFVYSVEAGQLAADEIQHGVPSVAFAQNISRVAVYCEANPESTKYADKNAVYLTGERPTGEYGFVWDYDSNTFYTDSSGLVCEVLNASPVTQDALHQLQTYSRSDMGRSEEGRTGILSDQRMYPPEEPRIVASKTLHQFLKDQCPTSQSKPKWCDVAEQPGNTIKPGDMVVHESKSVGVSGGVMVALSGMVTIPGQGTQRGAPHPGGRGYSLPS